MEYQLNIYKNGKLENSFSSKESLVVFENFKNAILADIVKPSIRVVKKKWPYADTLEVINTWVYEGEKHKYHYYFYGLTGLD